ncbi:MAG: hypothetical protein LBU66_00050 [Treponema sp.]|jgi:hypothetical protein|nr:hypothetical protein [Treponema sp.]
MDKKEQLLQKAMIHKLLNENNIYNEFRKYNLNSFLENIDKNDISLAFRNILLETNIVNEQENRINGFLEYFSKKKDPHEVFLEKLDIRFLDYIKNNQNISLEKLFDDEIPSAIISIDIRKSTELMLKAKNPLDFSMFITKLIDEMINIIEKNYGIIEKFTGDGLLAFFPEFYSENDCCSYAINSAIECHEMFIKNYHDSYKHFIALPSNTGLSIGIDYGDIIIKAIKNSINIIGRPVVYACRLGSIDADKTAINIGAYENIKKKYPKTIFYPEILDLKTGEKLYCYSIKEKINILSEPNWLNELPL